MTYLSIFQQGKAIIEFGNEESGANLINNPPVVDGRQVLSRAVCFF